MVGTLKSHSARTLQNQKKKKNAPLSPLSLRVYFSGDYIFAISSADGSELWLSTDDDPQNSKKIAYLGDVRRFRSVEIAKYNTFSKTIQT